MKHVFVMRVLGIAASLVPCGCSGVKFVHVPPGQSVLVAIAPKPEVVATPPPRPGPLFGLFRRSSPQVSEGGNTVADYYSIGVFCLQQGKTKEAVAALEKATQMDPGYGDAWNQLAIAYQNAGANDKALEAYKRAKAAPRP